MSKSLFRCVVFAFVTIFQLNLIKIDFSILANNTTYQFELIHTHVRIVGHTLNSQLIENQRNCKDNECQRKM